MEEASVSKFQIVRGFSAYLVPVLFGTTIAMYLYSVLPSTSTATSDLFTFYTNRITGLLAKFDSLPTHQLKDPFPRALRNPTLELASSNLICSVALTGVLALQAGRLWAERADDDSDDAVVETDEVKGVKTPDIREDIVKPLLQQRVQPSYD
jgi:hypothetical protein